MEQARDFLTECRVLDAVFDGLPDHAWEHRTQFKGWTLNDVLVHLHFWNRMADLSLNDPDAFGPQLQRTRQGLDSQGFRRFENAEITLRGVPLRTAWRALYLDMADRWGTLDPRQRVRWAGPDMSVRSAMTARQMETWAHGQAVFDRLGLDRSETDRIANIVVLGVNTFGWSFSVHNRAVPDDLPRLELTAPSGAVWTYGDDPANTIRGRAVDFARVVTQTRNVADTGLRVDGPVATEWMSIAQCFAGGAELPPSRGTRHRLRR